MRVLTPPASLAPLDAASRSVFLAGSIDMDNAPRWQDEVIAALADDDGLILNPRRADWDATWTQSADHAGFRGQVEWELEGLERVALIALYLPPGSSAPISLLELGLHARSGRLIVCCPEGFWRKGNVDIVCRRHDIPQVAGLAELIAAIRARLGR
ncbi:MAG: nucleoside 2-deoxyribosyltransferase domain-containing protein [Nannocystaceae bacterium]